MEKPRNYWLRAYVANGSAILYLILYGNFLPIVVPRIPYGYLILPTIAFFMGILSIMQGIRFKDSRYILLGILPLLAISAFFFYVIAHIN